MNDVSTSNQFTGLISSDSSNKSRKYGDLIKQSKLKRFRNDLLLFSNYCYYIASPFNKIHTIVTMIRIMQILFPPLMESAKIWDKNIIGKQFVNILAVFYHLVPPSTRPLGSLYCCYANLASSISFLFIFAGSSIYFAKYARIHNLLPNLIVLCLASVNFFMHPIGLYLTFDMISGYFFDPNYGLSKIHVIIITVLELVSFTIFFWAYVVILSQTIVFLPISLMAVIRTPSTIIFINTNALNAAYGLMSHAPKTVQVTLLFIASLATFELAFLPFLHGGYVSQVSNSLIMSSATSAGILVLAMAFTILFDLDIGLYLVFGVILLFPLLYVVCRLIISHKTVKNCILLDKFQDNPEENMFDKVSVMMNAVVDGMRVAHPVCLSGELFKKSLERWPKNVKLWFLFTKFASIYPEDNQTLSWAFHTIKNYKLKGATAKSVKEQSIQIMKQREANLSPSLKIKLNEAQAKSTSSKHKLRLVWDLAIQGNIYDMESSIKRFYSDMNIADSEFKHLLRQYPNNRFITRSYSRFCKELKADDQEYIEYVEKSKQLHRGAMVNEDLTHKCGLLAFPNLPIHSSNRLESITVMSTEVNAFSATQDNDLEQEDQIFEDKYNGLKDVILSMRIPSTLCAKISRILILLIIYIIPAIVLFVVTSDLPNQLSEAIPYMHSISQLSRTATLVCIFNTNYVYEVLNVLPPLIPQNNYLYYLGGEYDMKNMVLYLLNTLVVSLEGVTSFRTYSNSNSNVKKAQELIFGNNVNYTYYDFYNDSRSSMQTIIVSINDFLTQVTSMMNLGVVLPEFVNMSYVLNPVDNIDQINDVLMAALEFLNDYLHDQNRKINNLTYYILIGTIVFIIVVFVISLIVHIQWIQRTKFEAYRCITSLPKNVVSSLVENLRVLKNDEGNDITTTSDTDITRQEDNIMKILAACSETQSHTIIDQIMFIIATLIIIIFECVSTYFFILIFRNCSQSLITSAPNLHYITTLATQSMLCFSYLQIVSSIKIHHPARIRIHTIFDWVGRFVTAINLYNEDYHIVRFGNANKTEAAFNGFQDGVDNVKSECVDHTAPVINLSSMAQCYNVEETMVLIQSTIMILFIKGNLPGFEITAAEFSLFSQVWTLLISPIYDKFFGPILDSIVPTINKDMAETTKTYIPVLIILFIISIFMECIALLQVFNVERHIKSALLLLLHAPYVTIMSTPKIAAVISGDFSRNSSDFSKINPEFFDAIFFLLPDAIFVCDQDMKISFVSRSATKILGKSSEEMVGKGIKDLLSDERFDKSLNSIYKSNDTVEVSMRDQEGSIINLEVSSHRISSKYIVVMSDVTSTVRYNQLIQDELKRSDELLSTILPASLVPRVQAGEKNISFSVKLATIVFMDIVSFTPWCGSLPASKVMSTLNLLFKKIDSLMIKYQTITKIKCIGDCYMAAGGIFSDINIPAEHAREVVNFGLDSLEAILELDKELGEKLQMRVGINTGGPIVAGVLGIGKPTFEILGPAINMAQQMEHYGIPMKVHISRPVYELIYGESFAIKERGSIEVKNGSVLSYLVENRK